MPEFTIKSPVTNRVYRYACSQGDFKQKALPFDPTIQVLVHTDSLLIFEALVGSEWKIGFWVREDLIDHPE